MPDANGMRGNLPPGWAWAELDDLGRWTGGGTPSKENGAFWENGSIPWVSAKDMKADYVGADADRITAAALAGSAAKLINEGSILCVVRSGILRHTFPVSIADRQITINQDLRALTPHAEVSARYLQFYLRSQNGRILREYAKDGTTVSSVDPSKLGRIPCPIAPTAEQLRIVAKIEELFGEIEAGEQELAKAREGLSAYRRAVLKAAVTGELTREWREKKPPTETGAGLLKRILAECRAAWEQANLKQHRTNGRYLKRPGYREPRSVDESSLPALPTGWTWATLDQLATDTLIGLDRGSIYQSKEPAGSPYIKMNNVTTDGRVTLGDLVYVSSTIEEAERFAVRDGDLLFNTRNSKELVGKVGFAEKLPPMTVYNNNLMRLRFAGGVLSKFICLQMCSPDFRQRMEVIKKATTSVAAIYAKDLFALPLVLPPTAEQERIISEVEKLVGVASEAEEEVVEHERRLNQMRQSILVAAFSGKLVPQDPTDEPASVLLERLKAAKAAAPANGARIGKRGKRKAPPHPNPLRPTGAEREGPASAGG